MVMTTKTSWSPRVVFYTTATTFIHLRAWIGELLRRSLLARLRNAFNLTVALRCQAAVDTLSSFVADPTWLHLRGDRPWPSLSNLPAGPSNSESSTIG